MPCVARVVPSGAGLNVHSEGMPMHVYLLQSTSHPDQRHVGLTNDLKKRGADHNADRTPHTSKYVP